MFMKTVTKKGPKKKNQKEEKHKENHQEQASNTTVFKSE